MSDGRVKVSVILTRDDVDALQALATRHRRTVTETLRRAIATFAFVEGVECQGRVLLIADAGLNTARLVILPP